MRKGIRKILVTGGAGFIGSAFVRLAVKKGYSVSVVDKMTYAGDLDRLKEAKGKYRFYKADICDSGKINSIFSKEKPDAVVHFAAESHVDRSIRSARFFVDSNIHGTYVLLEASRANRIKRFVHISTDEVYGEIARGKFHEDSPLKPNSPYSATKAAADLLVNSYIRTYGFPALIIRPCNNYGPWQYPEKLIALSVLKLIKNERIPIYGRGLNVREWLFVDDCAEGILKILERGKDGSIYNLGSGQEKRNIEVVRLILKILGKPGNMFVFVKDRPGHDFRYSLESSKVKRGLKWQPKVKFEEGLRDTIKWFLKNRSWLLKKSNIPELYK